MPWQMTRCVNSCKEIHHFRHQCSLGWIHRSFRTYPELQSCECERKRLNGRMGVRVNSERGLCGEYFLKLGFWLLLCLADCEEERTRRCIFLLDILLHCSSCMGWLSLFHFHPIASLLRGNVAVKGICLVTAELHSGTMWLGFRNYPSCTCTRVTVLGLCVCLSVCLLPL